MGHTRITRHAQYRCRTRGISEEAVAAALDYGRHRHRSGADHYIIGWREVRYWAKRGVDISRHASVRVVCVDGAVLTTYRNRPRHKLGYGHHGSRYERGLS